jgi:hypothetical protein
MPKNIKFIFLQRSSETTKMKKFSKDDKVLY